MEALSAPRQKVRKHRIALAGVIGIIAGILLVGIVGASFVPESDLAFVSARNTWLCAKCGMQISSRWFNVGGRRIGRTPVQLWDGFEKMGASGCQHDIRQLGQKTVILKLQPTGLVRMARGRPSGDEFYAQKVVQGAMNSLAATNQQEARVVLDWLWRIRDSSSFPTNRLTALTTGDAMLLKQQFCAETDRYFGR